MAVELRFEGASGRRYARELQSDAQALMGLLKLESWELSLMIVGDRAMRNLNRRFRGKDRPTDVLSFAQIEERATDARVAPKSPVARARRSPPTASRGAMRAAAAPIGDVVISLETAVRQ